MEFQQLLPHPVTVEIDELLASLDDGDHAPSDRPHTAVNFVASVDGRVTFAGRSGVLGDDGDMAMFHGLREHADAVLVGTRTLSTERYGRMLNKAERRERRIARGLAPEPLACMFTRSGAIPLEIPLFAEPEARVVVFTAEDIDTSGAAAKVDVVRLDRGEATLTTVLRRLLSDYGVRTLLCEGGPTLFAGLLDESMVDELFLTIAPKLTGGGTGPTLTSGPELAAPRLLEIKWLLERNGSLYLRYGISEAMDVSG